MWLQDCYKILVACITCALLLIDRAIWR